MISTKRILLAFVAFCMATGLASPSRAQEQKGEVIDRVVAVVEDRALLKSELDMEVRREMMRLQKQSLPPDEEKALRKEVLDALITDLLMTVHAEKTGIQVPEERVEEEVERAVESNMRAIGGSDAFNAELARAGLTLQQLKAMWREKIKARFQIEEIFYSEISKNVKVTDNEVREYYRAHADSIDKRPATVTLAQIMIFMRPAAGADSVAREKISEIQKILASGADFAATAKKYSEGPSAKYGGSLGFMKLEDFGNPAFEKAVRGLITGEVSEPVLTEHGYHIIKLEDVSGDEVKLRHILVNRKNDKEATRAFAERLRQELIDGRDFAAAAAEYSDDYDTKERGGVVGEIEVTRLPDYFVEAIRGVGDGEIGKLVEEPKGFRIVKILGRAEARPFTYEEAKEGLRNLIEQEFRRGKYLEYVEMLKKTYYVDIKTEE